MKQAVALSGGPDSLCAAAHMPPGLALIVDHGLRSVSYQEADQAAEQAKDMGHEPLILKWEHGVIPKTQAVYRAGRYALLAEACQTHDIQCLWTGHQADDQTETLLLRMSMGSGLIGLSGMAQRTWLGNTRLYRPLLTKTKLEILAWIHNQGLKPSYDPSNMDLAYPRVAWRGGLALHPELSRKLRGLSLSIGNLRNTALNQISPDLAQVHGPGVITLSASVNLLSRTSLHELLAACVRWIGGRVFSPLGSAIDFILNSPRSRARIAMGGTLMSWRRDLEVFTLVPEVREQEKANKPLSLNLCFEDQKFDEELVRLASLEIQRRDLETKEGLWMPGNQQKYGGLILGQSPRFDHEFATNETVFDFRD